jgi:hypothetical protein
VTANYYLTVNRPINVILPIYTSLHYRTTSYMLTWALLLAFLDILFTTSNSCWCNTGSWSQMDCLHRCIVGTSRRVKLLRNGFPLYCQWEVKPPSELNTAMYLYGIFQAMISWSRAKLQAPVPKSLKRISNLYFFNHRLKVPWSLILKTKVISQSSGTGVSIR